MKHFFLALQFLTVLPVRLGRVEDEDFGKSLLYFPLAGGVIGALTAAAAFLAAGLPVLMRAAIVTIAGVLLSGGIHLDGFADTCDGLYGGKDKERALEIMRDSRIGVMGAAGISLLLILQFSAIASIPSGELWKALIAAAVFSRWAQAFACAFSRCARADGKALNFMKYARRRDAALGAVFVLAVFFFCWGPSGFLFAALSFVPVFVLMKWIERKIGGMTGDTIGALNEIAECAVLVLAAGAWFGR